MNNPKKNNDKYWLYLEPYTFIFKNQYDFVIYNTANGFYLKCPSDMNIQNIMNRLYKSNNGYCISITKNTLMNDLIFSFISQLRNSFSGDLINSTETQNKPFIFKPKLKIINKIGSSTQKNNFITGRTILKNLSEVTIYLNMTCKQSCKLCNQYYKQFTSCTKKKNMPEMQWEECFNLLNKLENSGIRTVNFVGGNILQYKYLDNLIEILPHFSFKKHLFIHFENIINEKIEKLLTINNLEIKFITPTFINEVKLQNTIKLFNNEPFYQFIISSQQEIQQLHTLSIFGKIEKIEFKVFYTGTNYEFFKENVFINYEDILTEPIDKKTIFRRKILNEHFYGRLIIFPNGDTYSNINHSKIGNLFIQSLNEIVYKEMEHGKSWFYTRNRSTCKTCCNKYLCPSPSNYEIVMKKLNMCNIKK